MAISEKKCWTAKSATSNGPRTVKKIFEIDGIKIFHETGMTAGLTPVSPRRKKRIPDPNWVAVAFTPAQQMFIADKKMVFRPHPRHNPTIEVFIDESALDERDWFMLHLLF
jgi:hypothetical protein